MNPAYICFWYNSKRTQTKYSQRLVAYAKHTKYGYEPPRYVDTSTYVNANSLFITQSNKILSNLSNEGLRNFLMVANPSINAAENAYDKPYGLTAVKHLWEILDCSMIAIKLEGLQKYSTYSKVVDRARAKEGALALKSESQLLGINSQRYRTLLRISSKNKEAKSVIDRTSIAIDKLKTIIETQLNDTLDSFKNYSIAAQTSKFELMQPQKLEKLDFEKISLAMSYFNKITESLASLGEEIQKGHDLQYEIRYLTRELDAFDEAFK